MLDLIISAVIMFLGLALHVVMKWAEVRKNVTPISFLEYIKGVPAQTAVSVIASAGSFLVVWQVGWLNPGMAFACGYMGNSVAENLATKFAVLPK